MTALLVALPFLAACAGLGVGRRAPRAVVPVAVGGAGLALLVAAAAAVGVLGSGRAQGTVLATVPTGGPPITVALALDPLAALVAVAVTAVALLVQVYSSAYLAGDPRYAAYAACVSLFTAAMLLVVVAADLLVLLVGWEVMGICSYFLIGHHDDRPDARAGAVKAFLTTRLGDVGFLFGIFTLGAAAGSFRVPDVLAAAPTMPPATLTAATLLLLAGVAGKSAQFPLHTWLPDAMAGPTPVSALIHAATMVAAGVYLVVRLHGAFLLAPTTLAVLAVITSVSMLGAALAALAQEDLKRVLAWSTVSQLAYMGAALAVGGARAGTFHLLSHAAWKALLFLAAGAVIHAVATNALTGMGGLRTAMPVTFATMTLGLGALVGVPPLAGFFSKEAVLGAAEEAALGQGPLARWAAWTVLVTGLLTVAVTAAYATRVWLRTFFGPSRSVADGPAPAGPAPAGPATTGTAPTGPAGRPAVHEAPPAMRWPLVALAVPTAGLGLLLPVLPQWLRGVPAGGAGLAPHLLTTACSLALAALGGLGTYALWRRDPAGDPARVLGRARAVLAGGFGVDAAYDRLVVTPVRVAARGVRLADRDVVDAYVRGAGVGARLLGGVLRRTQAGNVQVYLTGLLAGVVLLAVGAVVRQ